jgi:polysaccharide chain length determinant protein (PEP-CTERM system associated)
MLPGKTYTPEEILQIGWRHRWMIVVPFVLVTAGTVIGLRFVPDRFRSETLILVVPQRVNTDIVRSTVQDDIERRLQSISQQILSRTRLEAIIETLGLYQVERTKFPMEDIVGRMRKDIEVETVRGDAFIVSYTAPDPLVAQKVTERLASLFIEENVRDRRTLAEETSVFLESQLEDARARLVETEKRLEAFRVEHAGELPTQTASNMQALQMLQSQVQALNDSMARDRDRRILIERQLAEVQRRSTEEAIESKLPPASAGGDEEPSAGTASQQLAAARRQLEAMETRLTPEHPDIIRAKRIVRDLEAKAEEERKAMAQAGVLGSTGAPRSESERMAADLRAELETVSLDISGKQVQLNRLQGEIESYRAKLRAIPTRESEMTALMRDYDTLQSQYTSLLERRESSKMATELEERQLDEQFRVLDPAGRPEVPYSPNRLAVTGMGAAGGLAFGVGLIVLMELRNRSFRTENDILVAIGLPVLASIPRMVGQAERRHRRRLVLSGSAAALALVAVATAVAWRFLQ